MADYFTKYVEACPLPMKSADCAASSLYQTFCCHEAPVHIVTDQGGEFVDKKTKILMKTLFLMQSQKTLMTFQEPNLKTIQALAVLLIMLKTQILN